MACSPAHRSAALLTADLVLELGRCATAQVAAAIANAALLIADLVLELGRRAAARSARTSSSAAVGGQVAAVAWSARTSSSAIRPRRPNLELGDSPAATYRDSGRPRLSTTRGERWLR